MDIDINDSETSITTVLKHNQMSHVQEAITKDPENSTIVPGSTSGSLNPDNPNSSDSDLTFHFGGDVDVDGDGDGDGDDVVDFGDEVSDYDDDDDYIYDNDVDDGDDDYSRMQATFDNVDLPPGVEASISWLNQPSTSVNVPVSTSISAQGNVAGLSEGAEMSSSVIQDPASSKGKAIASSSSTVLTEEKDSSEDDVLRKFELFKQFDTVDGFSDHHFSNGTGFSGQQPPKAWVKKIQDEWKILEKDLPDSIYVRVSETRMDLLRAIIIGPEGTPYHDGLFVFDVYFPPTYPNIPPMVYYYSGGLRLNPNLYDCGKVCLSLLNTWSGKQTEMWMPTTSTMLQVLVSIQALILNARPFFNEPGYESSYVGAEGERRSNAYSEDVFILSLKTMVYTLRRPPQHFEDFVAGHFRVRAVDILSACKAYKEGALVGSLVRGRSEVTKGGSNEFKGAVGRMMNGLVNNFAKNGGKDCEQFRLTI